METVGPGVIPDGTGYATFPMKYQCIVFRPVKGEILEGVVTMVNKVCSNLLLINLFRNGCWLPFCQESSHCISHYDD
jgi:hypothetical protein